ncbi:MAG TPA: DUF2752 domain-containing protein [Methanocorpusculum sp.]|nr:DUF2752 domain-containing protein [Methanocorpusculum sp.]
MSALAVGISIFAAAKICGTAVSDILFGIIPPCYFRETVGAYCPGCGGVRSFVFLMQGDMLQSLLYHPFTLYAVILIAVFVIHYTLALITKNRIKKPLIHTAWLYAGAGIILIQWIVKLIFLLGFGIEIIPL